MPRISFSKTRASFEVQDGANLMSALLENGLPVASSCRGDGVCAKCRVRVVEGKSGLSPENDREKFLRERHGIERAERVSCQATVIGDIKVDTDYW